MNIEDFLGSRDGMKAENYWNRVVILMLSVAVLGLLYHTISKSEIVVLQPETLGTDAWVTKNDASKEYKEAWGFWLAQLTGNVTPANVTFIKERVGPLLSPKIYDEVIDSFEAQAQAIKDDRVSMRFEPKYVEYEASSNIVFVYGFSFVKGAAEKETREERTYEYDITINNYGPMFRDLDTYIGKPHTDEFLKREEQNNKNRKSKNA